MENIIRIEKVTFKYDHENSNRFVLDDININIRKGSFTAVIGHNGSGKSTLAKNLNAILLPSGGKIYVKDWDTRDEKNIWNVRQSAGMVFQNPDNQLVSAIVEDDVAFGPENLGMEPSEIKKRVHEALKSVGMFEYKNKGPHLLSGGQKQRIAIAGVIAMKPDCIIFDEPTAMLDPHGRKEVMDIIKKLNKEENITIIHITHFMEEAAMADRVIVIDKGKIILDGKPQDIFGHVEKLKALGLEVPIATELAFRLRKKGLKLPEEIITIEELVDYICQ